MRRHIVILAIFVVFSGVTNASHSPVWAVDPGDEYWSTDYHSAGVNGYIRAMHSDPGAVYAGGFFSAITDVPAANVARLDMSAGVITQVTPLGEGLDSLVKAFCRHNGDLIAVGNFNKSGTTTVNRVARWDGSTWHPLGNGLPDEWPQAVASYQGQIFASDYRWNGTTWENLFQANGTITSIVEHDGLLYFGGTFTEVQGEPYLNVFAWDGTNVLALGDGFPVNVYGATAGIDGVVFSGYADYGTGQVSSWDGSAWTLEWENIIAREVAYLGDDLVVSASIYLGGSMFTPHLQTNKGGTWHSIGNFNTGPLLEHEGRLLAKVNDGVEPGILSPGLIAYTGFNMQSVFPPSQGFFGNFKSITGFGGGAIVGGDFTIATGQEFDGSAMAANGLWHRWGNRSDLITSYPGSFVDLAAVGAEVFGVYSYVNYDVGVEILAKLTWDVDQWRWQTLDTGTWFSGLLQTVGTDLFNVGYGGVNLVDLQDGTTTVVPGFDVNGGVYGTCDYLGTMTVCGGFSTNNGLPSSNVIRYQDGSWVDVGNPLPGLRVLTVAPMDGSQLAASTWVDGVWRVHIFDGENWAVLPGDFNGKVQELVFHRGRLFAAGSFDYVGKVPARGVALWTGTKWAPIGSGLVGSNYSRVLDISSVGDNLHLVGVFSETGGQPSVGYAMWSGDPTLVTGDPSAVANELPASARLLGNVYPNPFNPRTNVSFVAPINGPVRIGIFDIRGNRVRELVNENFTAGTYSRIWNGLDDNGAALPSGIYFARMLSGNQVDTVKLTLVR